MPAVDEVFATAEDGAPLHWSALTPNPAQFPAPWPVEILIHGGGFNQGDDGSIHNLLQCQQDLAARGIAGVSIDYRLAPPGSIPGQTSDGRCPQQYNDVKRAALAALTPPSLSVLHGNVNGQVGFTGGSAGGSHAVAMGADAATQSSPVPWDSTKRPIHIVNLSGAVDFADASSLAAPPGGFAELVTNYCGVANPPSSGDLITLAADSPIARIDSTCPTMLNSYGTHESMPIGQPTSLVAKLNAQGVTNYVMLLSTATA